MQSGYCALAVSAVADGTALTASTTATDIMPANAKWTFPTQWFAQPGNALLVRAAGRISTVTTPGTLTLDLRLGSVIVATSGALTLSSTAKTNVSWYLEWLLTLRAAGATANFMHQGMLTSEALGATTVAGEAKTMMLPVSAPAVGSNFDSTASQDLHMFATWGTNNANSIQVHQFVPVNLGAP